MAFDGWFFGLGGSHSDLFDFGASLRSDDHFSPSSLLGDIHGFDLDTHGFEWRVQVETWLSQSIAPVKTGGGELSDTVAWPSFMIEDTPFVIGADEQVFSALAAPASGAVESAASEAAPTNDNFLIDGRGDRHYDESSGQQIAAYQNGWAETVAQIGDAKGDL